MKTKRANSVVAIIGSVFALVGLLMLVGGIIFYTANAKFEQTAVEIPGVISDIMSYKDSEGHRHHNVSVTYQYGGKLYEDVEINSYSSSMYEGQEITLLCDPNRPGKIRVSSLMNVGTFILIGMGVIFAGVGCSIVAGGVIGNIREKKLRTSGKTLYATVEKIVYNTSYSVNGSHPYVIYCEYRDDYKDVTYKFRSENLWTDPSDVFPEGSTIQVLVDEADYSRYHVIVDEVEKRIVDFT